ncbi:MAG TPA: hypothetical protein VH744_05220 [Terriglobales bacterium]
MPASAPKRQAEAQPSHHTVPRIYTLEATGLIIIALLVLVITVVRFWEYINWSAR